MCKRNVKLLGFLLELQQCSKDKQQGGHHQLYCKLTLQNKLHIEFKRKGTEDGKGDMESGRDDMQQLRIEYKQSFRKARYAAYCC